MVNEIHSDANSRMDKSLSSLENDFSKIRAGRAHPSLLEQITVEYYGAMVPLSQVSNISTEDSRTLKVSPWEKDMVGPIEKAIMTSDLGLNPNTQGQVLRIPLPPLTEERRKDLVKRVKAEGEAGKVAIRNIRKDVNEKIKKQQKEGVAEDDAKTAEAEVQKVTDSYIVKVDKHIEVKEKDIMTV